MTMLERETESILRTLTEQSIGSARSLALKDALATIMPRSIRLYLLGEVAQKVQEDLAGTGTKLPLTSPVVSRLLDAYSRELAPEYILTREEYLALLENGVHFVENYLCRPRWTLEHFMFEKGNQITANELERKLAYVCDYLYLSRLVEAFMRQRGMKQIGRDEFCSLIATIDDRVVAQHTPQEFARLARPIFEFLLLETDVRSKPVTVNALLVFLQDKRMAVEAEYVEKVCHIRSVQDLTLEQFGAILEDLRTAPRSSTHREPGHETVSPVVAPPPTAVAPPEPTAGAEEPLTPPQGIPEPPQIPAAGSDRRNIALSLTYSGMAENAPPTPPPPPDLRKEITPDQRDRFIKTIFHADESYYNAVIEALNGIRSWKEASLYLQTFYTTTGIDPHLPEAIEFSDSIQLRYLLQQQS